MSAEQCFLRKAFSETLRNVRIRLVHELFDQLHGRRRFENVVFDRDIFIINLVEQAKRCDGFTAGTQAGLPELLGNTLLSVSGWRQNDVLLELLT